MPPKELVACLNEYFSLASDLILKNEAMLDKYIGDAIMAIFGAPIPRPDHAKIACLTSLQIQKILRERYNGKSGDPSNPVFETRIGLNTGRMVVGNIGRSTRLDCTAIGDTVNLASRLEGVNKIFGTHIISKSTYEQAKDVIDVRELDLLKVKGKNIPIRIYELTGEKGSAGSQNSRLYSLFAEARQLYKNQKFFEAERAFRSIMSEFPYDGPSGAYADRCAFLQQEILPEDWNGVFALKTK